MESNLLVRDLEETCLESRDIFRACLAHVRDMMGHVRDLVKTYKVHVRENNQTCIFHIFSIPSDLLLI